MTSAPPESFDHEFPKIPEGFRKFEIEPISHIKVKEKRWKSSIALRNRAKTGVLFKVKCNSNARLKIVDCADILLPGNEVKVEMERSKKEPEEEVQVTVFYCLVGDQTSGSPRFP
ncbi:hypothetical protein L596_012843 [Steinernema carpocapsae]|uniref:MSP domain-containing protein n=1 Tax=Steinernema carpocapsae TaxID=34508 RepID=A0A4U5NZ96_STECR|nr:hypothetical protein L596_012843 [Steinernema carpocapsae]